MKMTAGAHKRPSRTKKSRPWASGNGALRLAPAFEFLRTLWLLNHRLETTSSYMMSTIGVTGPQRMLLRVVGSNPGIAAGALAETLHVHPGTLSSALKRLEQGGLLLRTPDPGDRRRILISLTPAGRKLDKPMPHTVESGIRAALDELPARQAEIAQHVLSVVARHLLGPDDAG